MSSWRIVASTGGAFWLERNDGAQGESLYFANGRDGAAAYVALGRHLASLASAELDAFVLAAHRELAGRKGARRG